MIRNVIIDKYNPFQSYFRFLVVIYAEGIIYH